MSRTKEGPAKEDEEQSEDGAREQTTVTKRPSRVTSVNTLVSNPSDLNLRKLDLEFAIDPLFCKASASFDDHGGRGLLLSHLSVYNGIVKLWFALLNPQTGTEIIFDSSDALNSDTKHVEDSMVEQSALEDTLVNVFKDFSKLEVSRGVLRSDSYPKIDLP